MKFLIDMPLSPDLARWLVSRGHDAVHASELGLFQAPDEAIIARAVAEERVVVTADLDYPRLLTLAGAREPGLILFRGGDFSDSESIERFDRVLRVVPAEELSTSIVVIERARIRRRRLSP